jgi:hypothetical protein
MVTEFIENWCEKIDYKMMLKTIEKCQLIDDENGRLKIIKNRPKIDPL